MKCEAEVPYKLTFYRTRRCKRNATVTVDGKNYCSIHNPETVLKRNQKKAQHFEDGRKLKLAMYIAELQMKALRMNLLQRGKSK
jgi:hypothetical protein